MSGGRRALAALLLVVAGLLLPVAVLAVWADRTVSDTEVFVSRVAPTVRTPEVQELIVARAAERAQGDLAAALVAEVVRAVVTQPALGDVVEGAVAAGHADLVDALESPSGSGSLVINGGTVELSLRPLGEALRDRLAAQGVPGALVPEVQATVPLTSVERFDQARRAYRVVDTLGWLAPVAVVAMTVLGLVLRRRVAGGLVLLGLVGAVGCAVLAIVATALPSLLAGGVADPLTADASRVVADALTDPLVSAAWWTAAGAAAVAVVAAVVRSTQRRSAVGPV